MLDIDLGDILERLDGDKKLEELIKKKAKKFKDDIIDLLSSDKKDQAHKKEDNSLLEKISHEMRQISSRLSKYALESYDEVARVTRVKLARVVDLLEQLVDAGEIGINELDAHIEHIEQVFNPQSKKDFSMRNLRRAFDILTCDMNDDLGMDD